MYSIEAGRANYDIYDFKLKQTLWSPWFIQKYFSVTRVKEDYGRLSVTYINILEHWPNAVSMLGQRRKCWAH